MIQPWTLRILAATSLGITSCAIPAHEALPGQDEVATKPPLMNGRGKVSSISIPDFFPLQQSGQVLLYDARPHFFYSLGHLPGAISLPISGCDTQIAKREPEIKAALAAKKTIVVYCTNYLCPDARTLATHLADFGHSSSTLTGGWESWKERELPTE